MDVENIFRDVKLSKTEMTVLRFIQNDPEQCIRQGVRAVAEQCYSNPSSLVRLAKKLKFSGWLELVYFIKFNITMPKLDVTNDIVTGVNASLALWPDYEILEQKNAACFDSIWIISKSGRSSSALNWVKALEGKEINLVCFTGDYQSPLAQAADTAFIIHDPQKFDDDIYWSNPFFGYCILGFERLLKMWFTSLRSNS